MCIPLRTVLLDTLKTGQTEHRSYHCFLMPCSCCSDLVLGWDKGSGWYAYAAHNVT